MLTLFGLWRDNFNMAGLHSGLIASLQAYKNKRTLGEYVLGKTLGGIDMFYQLPRIGLILMLTLWAFASPAAAKLYIKIDISDQEMTVSNGGFFGSHRWKISTARPGYVTPHGTYKPYLLKTMHYSSKYDNSPMPHSIFFKGGYAIHATPYVKNLGRPASHGCIRLDPRHAKRLFELVKSAGNDQTTIEIVP